MLKPMLLTIKRRVIAGTDGDERRVVAAELVSAIDVNRIGRRDMQLGPDASHGLGR
jgi:hypothetical protein